LTQARGSNGNGKVAKVIVVVAAALGAFFLLADRLFVPRETYSETEREVALVCARVEAQDKILASNQVKLDTLLTRTTRIEGVLRDLHHRGEP
jgi:hypothetical protein